MRTSITTAQDLGASVRPAPFGRLWSSSRPSCQMFLSLPSDVFLHIFSYLSLHDLRNVELVSRETHSLLLAHEESIYHQAAISYGFVESQTLLEDAIASGGSLLSGVRDWKEYCRRRYVLERNWDGDGYLHEGGYQPANPSAIMSFSIDEQQGTSITLVRDGGLFVRALEDGRLLWALSHVRFPAF